jgi:D-sedoheptulose 7-phosphate isomerase
LLEQYLNGLRYCLDEMAAQDINEIASIIYDAYCKGRQVFIMGNGGSAATASHFANDLRKGSTVEGKPRVQATSITDNIALITAIANDEDYSSIFTGQLLDQLKPGDVVIAISSSGNSPNILKAIEYAGRVGAVTIGFAGFGGGRLKELTHKCIILSSHDYGQVEDAHLSLAHIVSYMVKERMANGK